MSKEIEENEAEEDEEDEEGCERLGALMTSVDGGVNDCERSLTFCEWSESVRSESETKEAEWSR